MHRSSGSKRLFDRARRLIPARGALALALAICLLLAVARCRAPDPSDARGAGGEGSAGLGSLLSSVDDLPEELAPLLSPWTGDLDAMVERRVIRLLTVFSPMLYFLDGPEPRGIVYESASAFEQTLNDSLGLGRLPVRVVIVPVLRDDLIPALVEGRGDIAAANLTITGERLDSVQFSEPLLRGVRELVVTGREHPALLSTSDLAGMAIHVRRSSSYRESLEALNLTLAARDLEPVTIVEMPELLEDDDLLEMVHADLIPATVVDSHKYEFWAKLLDGIVAHPSAPVREGGEIAWALRKDSPQLERTINRFVRDHRKGTLFGNVVYGRYLDDTSWMVNAADDAGRLRLRGYKPLFEKYAGQYDLDWVLLAAQSFQESRLDNSLRSHRGAIGLMQLMPETAGHMGIEGIDDPERNIHAGAKYMRWILDTYFDDGSIDPAQRNLFALAAYNAGPTRIRRLRADAGAHGLDPDRWFDSVEIMAARDIGAETVRYVGNVVRYWIAYRLILTRWQMERERGRNELTSRRDPLPAPWSTRHAGGARRPIFQAVPTGRGNG